MSENERRGERSQERTSSPVWLNTSQYKKVKKTNSIGDTIKKVYLYTCILCEPKKKPYNSIITYYINYGEKPLNIILHKTTTKCEGWSALQSDMLLFQQKQRPALARRGDVSICAKFNASTIDLV